ncbi:MAG: DUF1540 domain-containing protein [Halanaerobiales bacterium]|nr:DUF1540 domain-containing protein [Halanaerobiales bacterium]
MDTKITCHVVNCGYNENDFCTKNNIRVACNTPKATGPETVNCMSFKVKNGRTQI